MSDQGGLKNDLECIKNKLDWSKIIPLTDIGSYVPVMDEFSAHWTDTNAILGGTAATDSKLEWAVTLAMFITLRNDIAAKLTAEEGFRIGTH